MYTCYFFFEESLNDSLKKSKIIQEKEEEFSYGRNHRFSMMWVIVLFFTLGIGYVSYRTEICIQTWNKMGRPDRVH